MASTVVKKVPKFLLFFSSFSCYDTHVSCSDHVENVGTLVVVVLMSRHIAHTTITIASRGEEEKSKTKGDRFEIVNLFSCVCRKKKKEKKKR